MSTVGSLRSTSAVSRSIATAIITCASVSTTIGCSSQPHCATRPPHQKPAVRAPVHAAPCRCTRAQSNGLLAVPLASSSVRPGPPAAKRFPLWEQSLPHLPFPRQPRNRRPPTPGHPAPKTRRNTLCANRLEVTRPPTTPAAPSTIPRRSRRARPRTGRPFRVAWANLDLMFTA